jgi:polyisoprenoid-binding protein YceI
MGYGAKMPTRRHEIGPANATLLLRTARQGLAAQVGHDLTIEVTQWSAVVVTADDPADASLEATIDTDSLRVVEGKGGLKPLSESDKREIQSRARKILAVDRSPEATYISTAVTPDTSGGATVAGALTLRGVARDVTLAITRTGPDRYRATGTVVQSAFGITPYSAMFGALRLADPVGIDVEMDLSG